MLEYFELLRNVLIEIEESIGENIDAAALAERFSLSQGHLRRLFSFSFKQSIAGYIRSRRLAASLDDLLKTDFNVLDIALEYGFEYERSYIRAFKREFGVTPGELRKSGQVVKVKPPIHLFDENKLSGGIIFEPEIVMVPQFHVIGKRHQLKLSDSRTAPGREFWRNESTVIKNVSNHRIYIGLTRNFNRENGYSDYLASIQVKNPKGSASKIPQGLEKDTFVTSLCARFRYIGQHHYSEIDRVVASSMYNGINKFSRDNQAGYALSTDKVFFEKIDTELTELYDGKYCQMEWFTPVLEKI